VRKVVITLEPGASNIDQVASAVKWTYKVEVDGQQGAPFQGFANTDAALTSVAKYLKYLQNEEKTNERGPN
jgi:hypothetical protein